MGTKKRQTTVVEKQGVNFVRDVVDGANCIFHEIHKENDFGNDAIIEFVDDENVLGKSIAVQIKSGSSYCTEQTCTIPADRAHFEYWAGHSLVVLGIVYDPSEKCAYWTNITKFLKGNRGLIRRGPYSITFRKTDVNRFNKLAFDQIFLPLFLRKPLLLDYETSVAWALDEDYDKHCLGIRTLLYRHRDNIETWHIYFQILCERPVDITDPYLVYILAHIPGHPDIVWHENNTLDPQLRQKVRRRIKAFSSDEVAKLISFVDEFGFDRGTIGQNVDAIVRIVAHREHILRDIVEDKSVWHQVRVNALILYTRYEHRDCVAFLEYLIQNGDDVTRPVAQNLIEHFEDLDDTRR